MAESNSDSVQGEVAPAKGKGKRGKPNVSMVEFAKIAKTSKSIAEIAQRTGLTQNSVSTKLTGARKKGIKVPNFQRGGGGARLDVAAINAELDAMDAETTETVEAVEGQASA